MIERFVLNAKPVPLTDRVRFDKREWRLVAELREALAAERPFTEPLLGWVVISTHYPMPN